MKNLTTLKCFIICCLLAGSCSYSFANFEIPGALKGNWQNQMTGLPESIESSFLVLLDSNNKLEIYFDVYTTSNHDGVYDPLYINFDFDGITGQIPVILSDLDEVAQGVFNKTYVETFNFQTKCDQSNGERPMIIDIMYGLVTDKPGGGGGYVEYTFGYNSDTGNDNTALFNPVVIPNLIATQTYKKPIACTGYISPGGLFVTQDNQNTISTDRVDSEVEVDLTPSDFEINLLNNISAKSTVYPNPFISEVNLTYQLATSGAVEIHIIDMNGKPVVKRKFGWQEAGMQEQLFNFTSALSTGNYRIIIYHPKKVETIQLIKF